MLLSFWIGRGSTGLSAASWIVVAWLITYSVHAALSASLAALCARPRRNRAVALGSAGRHHKMWKLALWLPLVTALGSSVAANSAAKDLAVHGAAMRSVAAAAAPGERANALLVVTRTPAAGQVAQALAGAALFALLLGLARFARSVRHASRQLRTRLPARNPRFLQSLDRVSRSSSSVSVRLTESDSIDGPMVVGTSEICLPADGMPVLSEQELDAVLAHELAHLERRDGLWVPLTALLRACLWFHPLTRWVSSRVAETAELACDDRAASLVSDPAILARALARVAAAAAEAATRDATKGGPKAATKDGSWSLLPAMASPRSKLFVRVQRLAQPAARSSASGPRALREHTLTMALVVLSFACLGISVQSEPKAEAALGSPPAVNRASLEATMTELFADESRVSAKLAETLAAMARPGGAAEESPAIIELRQELSHVHQMQAWIEAQLAAATATGPGASASGSSRPSS